MKHILKILIIIVACSHFLYPSDHSPVELNVKLHKAVSNSDFSLVQELLALRADPNFLPPGTSRPLLEKARTEFITCGVSIQVLIPRFGLDASAVQGALKTKRASARAIISLLLQNKANPNAQSSIGNGMLSNALSDTLRSSLGTSIDTSDFKENIAYVEELLAHRADPNIKTGDTTLLRDVLIFKKNHKMVVADSLLRAGAKPDATIEFIIKSSSQEELKEQAELLELLLKYASLEKCVHCESFYSQGNTIFARNLIKNEQNRRKTEEISKALLAAQMLCPGSVYEQPTCTLIAQYALDDAPLPKK